MQTISSPVCTGRALQQGDPNEGSRSAFYLYTSFLFRFYVRGSRQFQVCMAQLIQCGLMALCLT